MQKLFVLALGSLLFNFSAHAEEQNLEASGSFNWLNAVVYTALQESAVNPDNTVLATPTASFQSELRPNLKITSRDLAFLVRPRVRFALFRTEIADNVKSEQTETSARWSEVFAQWTLSDSLLFAYGLQNYQWGPAESLSPSNRIFHETSQNKSVIYETQGKHIARVNLSLGRAFSSVMMAEVDEYKQDGDTPHLAEQEFASTTLIKNEINWNSGADYLGIVVGARSGSKPWLGEYMNLTLPFFDAITLYTDISHEHGSKAWYPKSTELITPEGPTSVVSFEQSKTAESKIYTLAVAGTKYAFENGSEIHGEFIYNQAGYTEEEYDLAISGFRSKSPAQLQLLEDNTARFLAPGLELIGQRYAFFSASVPDFLTFKDFTFMLRALHALGDRSTSVYNSFEYTFATAGTMFAASTSNIGKADQELARFSKNTVMLGYRQAW